MCFHVLEHVSSSRTADFHTVHRESAKGLPLVLVSDLFGSKVLNAKTASTFRKAEVTRVREAAFSRGTVRPHGPLQSQLGSSAASRPAADVAQARGAFGLVQGVGGRWGKPVSPGFAKGVILMVELIDFFFGV